MWFISNTMCNVTQLLIPHPVSDHNNVFNNLLVIFALSLVLMLDLANYTIDILLTSVQRFQWWWGWQDSNYTARHNTYKCTTIPMMMRMTRQPTTSPDTILTSVQRFQWWWWWQDSQLHRQTQYLQVYNNSNDDEDDKTANYIARHNTYKCTMMPMMMRMTRQPTTPSDTILTSVQRFQWWWWWQDSQLHHQTQYLQVYNNSNDDEDDKTANYIARHNTYKCTMMPMMIRMTRQPTTSPDTILTSVQWCQWWWGWQDSQLHHQTQYLQVYNNANDDEDDKTANYITRHNTYKCTTIPMMIRMTRQPTTPSDTILTSVQWFQWW